jgi:2,4-dienoyl-CoA reductase-like NADH-dependent reductase (Old Yellow Enzyme family)
MSELQDNERRAFTPLRIGPLTLRNRFIKSATNEGSARGGTASKRLVQFHEAIAAGGIGMTTVAYCAVAPDGRTFIDQVTLDAAAVPHLKVLTAAVHRHGAAASAQITHGGCFTFVPPADTPRPLSSSGGFNRVSIMSGQYCARRWAWPTWARRLEFVRGAQLSARRASMRWRSTHRTATCSVPFAAVQPPHGCLRRQRPGARCPVEVLKRVLDAVGKEMAGCMPISVTDGA